MLQIIGLMENEEYVENGERKDEKKNGIMNI
jgi:hypothetical protein